MTLVRKKRAGFLIVEIVAMLALFMLVSSLLVSSYYTVLTMQQDTWLYHIALTKARMLLEQARKNRDLWGESLDPPFFRVVSVTPYKLESISYSKVHVTLSWKSCVQEKERSLQLVAGLYE